MAEKAPSTVVDDGDPSQAVGSVVQSPLGKKEISRQLMKEMSSNPEVLYIDSPAAENRKPEDGIVMFVPSPHTVLERTADTTLLGRAMVGVQTVIDIKQYHLPGQETPVFGVVDRSALQLTLAEKATAGEALSDDEVALLEASHTHFVYEGASLSVGRDADMVIDDPTQSVSRKHATISVRGGRVFFEDKSSLGSMVFGDRDYTRVPRKDIEGEGDPVAIKQELAAYPKATQSGEIRSIIEQSFKDRIPVPEEVVEDDPEPDLPAEKHISPEEARKDVAEAFGDVPPATGEDKEAPEGPSQIVRTAADIIRTQMNELEEGNGVTHTAKLDESEPEPETETEESIEEQKTPEQIIREACATPQSLMEAMRESEHGPEIRRAVTRLVEAFRDASAAEALNGVWDSEIVPKIQRLGGAPAELRKEIDKAEHELSQGKRAIANFMDGAISHRRGFYGEEHTESMRRLSVEAERLEEMVTSGKYKEPLIAVSERATRDGFTTLFSEDEVSSLRRKISSRRDEPPTPEEIQSLYDQYGAELSAGGLESFAAVRNRVDASTEDRTPNWRRRRDVLEQLLNSVARISRSDLVDGRDKSEALARNALGMLREDATKIFRVMRDQGYPENSIRKIQEGAVSGAIGALDGIMVEFDDLRRMTRYVEQVVQEIK